MVGTGAKGAGPYINGLNDTIETNSTSGANRRRLLSLASYVAKYNDGFGVGPGYCDEDTIVAGALPDTTSDNPPALTSRQQHDGLILSMTSVALLSFLVLWGFGVTIYLCCGHAIKKLLKKCCGHKVKKIKNKLSKFKNRETYGEAKFVPASGMRFRGNGD
jgi:hypothetical protein